MPSSKIAWIATNVLEFLFFFLTSLAWLYYFEEHSVFWIGLPVLPFHLWMTAIRKKYCRCPNCSASLLGVGYDGDNVFGKRCENCGFDLSLH